ncbi:nucleotide exchange factor GrpE [Cohnella sp. CFH 77786]|nr:nucleotide exchange factor GrpE [Cohnella sp. CFH 77786]
MNESKEQERMAEEQAERFGASPEGAQEPEADNGGSEEAEGASADEAQEDPRVAELQRQLEESQNRHLRVQADFDNFRRRTLKEKEELAQYASLKLVGQLLPVLDNFERALQSGSDAGETGSFAKGVDMIYRQLSQVLEAEGLRKMEAAGTPFDPELHQAIMQVESEEHEEGTVVEVVQNGYWLKDKVLRPAMVKVSG